MLLIVFQLGAQTTATPDVAPVEQPGSDDLQSEALEGSADRGDGIDVATQTVKLCTFLECNLLHFLRPVCL